MAFFDKFDLMRPMLRPTFPVTDAASNAEAAKGYPADHAHKRTENKRKDVQGNDQELDQAQAHNDHADTVADRLGNGSVCVSWLPGQHCPTARSGNRAV